MYEATGVNPTLVSCLDLFPVTLQYIDYTSIDVKWQSIPTVGESCFIPDVIWIEVLRLEVAITSPLGNWQLHLPVSSTYHSI